MGLDVVAYRTAVLTEPHPNAETCVDLEHIPAFHLGFEESFRGLLWERCYECRGEYFSRKGAVGKTTESLAPGFLAAQAVEVMGGSAVVLDASLTNADISVKLHLPPSAHTVRDLVTALMSNAIPPAPVAVRRSSLRVYGEHRETERYDAREIAELAGHVRRYYTVTVVDLPKAIPGIEDRAEAVVDAWLPHADVVVIPVDTSIASFEGGRRHAHRHRCPQGASRSESVQAVRDAHPGLTKASAARGLRCP